VQRYNFFPNKQALFLIILNKSFCLLIINQLYSNLISSFLSLRAPCWRELAARAYYD